MSSSIPGMMNGCPVCHSAAVLRPRLHPNLLAFFEEFYEDDLKQGDPLLMEMGGAFFSFAPEHYPQMESNQRAASITRHICGK